MLNCEFVTLCAKVYVYLTNSPRDFECLKTDRKSTRFWACHIHNCTKLISDLNESILDINWRQIRIMVCKSTKFGQCIFCTLMSLMLFSHKMIGLVQQIKLWSIDTSVQKHHNLQWIIYLLHWGVCIGRWK
jgi:hypothetical protein